MAESVQSNQSGNVARSHAPAPREKITVSLTTAQAEMLRALWQEHSTALHAMLKGWCGDAQNASDMLQEVFRRLAQSPAAMTRMKNARAFLAVSARRIAVDSARRSKTRSDYQTAAGAEAPTVENPGPTDENLRAAITEALGRLPAEQRSVFEHKILNGRTLEEISRLERVSLNTVSSRLRYALDKIRGQLRPYYDDLNRKDFKLMKNDPSNIEDTGSQRIITPLQPKRVPSVAPGLEGLAAMAPDACEAAPEIVAPEAEFVAAAGEAPIGEMADPEIAFCGVGGNAWEQSLSDSVELPVVDGENISADESAELFVTGEIPEMISCELLPPDGEIPREWLEQLENFFVTLFEGQAEQGAGEEAANGEGVPFEFETGFEICVLPVPEEFMSGVDPDELLLRYDEFLRDNPDWGGLDPDVMEAQVVTPSNYIGELHFGTPSQAAAFDSWYQDHYQGPAFFTTDEWTIDAGNDHESGPDDTAWSLHPKDLVARYNEFLLENPDWGALDPDVMEAQVVTPSILFAELEFGTPSKAAAFDDWFVNFYSVDFNSGSINVGGDGGDYGTDISGDLYSGDKGLVQINGGIPAEWMRGGTIGNAGLMLNGVVAVPGAGVGNLSVDGVPSFEGSTVVTGGEIALGDGVAVANAEGNTLTLSDGSTVVLQGGQVVSGEMVYAYNPEFGADPIAPAVSGELPTEIILAEASGLGVVPSLTTASAGLAPTPGAALIVEFSVLSPSETIQPVAGSQVTGVQPSSRDTIDLPNVFSAATNFDGVETAAISIPTTETLHDLPSRDAAFRHESAATTLSSHSVAAGAVAAGTVVHGGAAAPTIRRPFPKA